MLSDVEKAFLQILLAEEDRDKTRSIWLKDIFGDVVEENLLHLRFKRVLFGPSPSPFMMNATIQYHLSLYDLDDSVVQLLKRSLYSDNVCCRCRDRSRWSSFPSSLQRGVRSSWNEFAWLVDELGGSTSKF